MIREEVIEILEKYKTESEEDHYVRRAKALGIAIETLEQELRINAISKQAVLDAIEDSDKNKDFKYFISKNAAKCFKRIIRDLPPVTPIEKVGYWVLTPCGGLIIDDWGRIAGVDTTSYDISCSNCGKGHRKSLPDNGKTYKGTPYCPWCGAKILGVKMEVEECQLKN